MKRYIPLLLFPLISVCSFGQTWTTISNYQKPRGVWVTDIFRLPSDTTSNKTGLVSLSGIIYSGNGTYWERVGKDYKAGYGLAGTDTLRADTTVIQKKLSIPTGEFVYGTGTGVTSSNKYFVSGNNLTLNPSGALTLTGDNIVSISGANVYAFSSNLINLDAPIVSANGVPLDTFNLSTRLWRQKGIDSVRSLIPTAGYGLTASLKVDSLTIANYRVADSISRSVGVLTTTIAAHNDTAVRKDMSDIVKLPDGSWLMVYTKYRTGAGDGNVSDINWATSLNGGISWTEHGRAYSNFSTSIYQASIKVQPDGDVIILFNVKTGTNTAEIYKGRLANGATTWDAPTSVYNPSAYLVQAAGRIFDDYSYSGKWFYPFELSSNGAMDCANVLSTGKFLTSTDYGDTWSLSGVTITSSDNKVEEPGMYRIADSLYYYWRNTTGFVLGSKSTNSGTSFGSQFSYGITAPCSMTTMKYFSDLDLLVAVHNKYISSAYGASSRAIFQIDASSDRGGSFSPVYVFPKYDGYYLHQPTIFRDNGYVVVQYSKIKLNEDSASLLQSIFPATTLIPKNINYMFGNQFIIPSFYKATIDASNLNSDKLFKLQNVSTATFTLQNGTLTTSRIPFASTFGVLTNGPYWDSTTTNNKLGIGGVPAYSLHVQKDFSINDGIVLTDLTSGGSASGGFASFSNTTSSSTDFAPAFKAKPVGNQPFTVRAVKSATGGASTASMWLQVSNASENGAISSTDNAIKLVNWTTDLLNTMGDGRVGTGSITSPTAWLHVPASTTSYASVRIPSGTAPTSPNNGDMWYDGTDLKFRTSTTTTLARIVAAPATATSTGVTGTIAYDSSYIYVCVATNTWVRAALATW